MRIFTILQKKKKTLRELQDELIPKYITSKEKRTCNLTRLNGDNSNPYKSR